MCVGVPDSVPPPESVNPGGRTTLDPSTPLAENEPVSSIEENARNFVRHAARIAGEDPSCLRRLGRI